jgi:hypothetical protein
VKTTSTIITITLILILSGCSGATKVRFDYDRGEDFSKFKTYNFLPLPESLKSEANPMVIRRIEEGIALAMGDKGFERIEANPDILIAIHTERQEKFDVNNWGYAYAPYDHYYRSAGYWGASGMDVYRYQQGTLIIDIIHAADKELIWRGVGSKALPQNPTVSQIDRTVNQVVSKILANFPPK